MKAARSAKIKAEAGFSQTLSLPGLVPGLRPVTPEVRLRLILCTGRSPGKMRYGAEPRNGLCRTFI